MKSAYSNSKAPISIFQCKIRCAHVSSINAHSSIHILALLFKDDKKNNNCFLDNKLYQSANIIGANVLKMQVIKI